MANTTFAGPIRTGQETGVTATNTIGHVIASQIATVRGNTSGAQNVVIPANSDIRSIRFIVVCAASAATSIAGQGINFRIGRVAGNDAYFGTIKVSGPRAYELGINGDALNQTGASGASWFSLVSATQVFIDATAVTSVSALGELGGRIYFEYFQRK